MLVKVGITVFDMELTLQSFTVESDKMPGRDKCLKTKQRWASDKVSNESNNFSPERK